MRPIVAEHARADGSVLTDLAEDGQNQGADLATQHAHEAPTTTASPDDHLNDAAQASGQGSSLERRAEAVKPAIKDVATVAGPAVSERSLETGDLLLGDAGNGEAPTGDADVEAGDIEIDGEKPNRPFEIQMCNGLLLDPVTGKPIGGTISQLSDQQIKDHFKGHATDARQGEASDNKTELPAADDHSSENAGKNTSTKDANESQADDEPNASAEKLEEIKTPPLFAHDASRTVRQAAQDTELNDQIAERTDGLRGDFADVIGGEPLGSDSFDNTPGAFGRLGALLTLADRPEINEILESDQPRAEKVVAMRQAQVLDGMKVIDLGGGRRGGFARAAAALGAEAWLVDWEEPDGDLGDLAGYIHVDLNAPDAAEVIAAQAGSDADFVTENIIFMNPCDDGVKYFGPESIREVGKKLIKDGGHYYYDSPPQLFRKPGATENGQDHVDEPGGEITSEHTEQTDQSQPRRKRRKSDGVNYRPQSPEQVAAFEQLYEGNYGKCRLWAKKAGTLQNELDDVVHDAFARAYDSWNGVRPDTNREVWLNWLVRTSAINAWRKTQFQRSPKMAFHDEAAQRALDNAPDSSMPVDEQAIPGGLGRLAEIIDISKMTESQKTHVGMLALNSEGYKYKEIADRLGIPLGTVMSGIARGRKLLKPLVAEHYPRYAQSAD